MTCQLGLPGAAWTCKVEEVKNLKRQVQCTKRSSGLWQRQLPQHLRTDRPDVRWKLHDDTRFGAGQCKVMV